MWENTVVLLINCDRETCTEVWKGDKGIVGI